MALLEMTDTNGIFATDYFFVVFYCTLVDVLYNWCGACLYTDTNGTQLTSLTYNGIHWALSW